MELEIVQVIQELSTQGGAERVAWELARAFGRAGVKNTAVTSTLGEPVGGNTKIQRVAAWLSHIPTRGVFRHIGRAIVIPFFTIAASFAVRRRRDAAVLSHGDSLLGDAVVVHAINAENLSQKRLAGNWQWTLNLLHLWVWLRDSWMIRGLRYKIFVAVSARVSADLQRLYGVPPSRIRIIPNGIDVERFKADPIAGQAIRKEFGIPDDAKLIVFVGHEFRRKGLAPAVAAFERLGGNFRMLVVGSDNPAPYRKASVGDRLIFAGSRYDMTEIYSAADLFVLPTSYETFSLVCMEAMACSVPVLATRVGGIEDYLEDGVNGFGITEDPDDIAEKIQRVLSDELMLARLRLGARATAMNYRWDKIAAQYIELMGQIQLEKHGAPPPKPVVPLKAA
ncbi:MAG TPA: glycosyltransferase family 4 protein [Xanthobacteraceae bacterium]|nr:glycosyltransferase family 4 protein [Xanthobacteraceae bacterium]